jgi:hypothetical protein
MGVTRWVSEQTLRETVQNKSVQEYEAARAALGFRFPRVGQFRRIYGKTFAEVRDGIVRGVEQSPTTSTPKGRKRMAWVSEDELRKTIQGMTSTAYLTKRLELGPRFPTRAAFQALYGKTFQEIRDGARLPRPGDWATEDEVREAIQRMTAREYREFVRNRGDARPRFPPDPDRLPFVYGKTFTEIRDGVKQGSEGKASEAEVREAIQGMRLEDYMAARERLGARFPVSKRFPRIYSKTFAEIRDGVRGKKLT